MTVFEVFTGPLELEIVLPMIEPYPPFATPAPFDAGWVKLGQLKDPAKIREKIDTAQQKYEEECRNAYPKWERDKAAYEEKELDKAGKSALTGQILAVGYGNYGGPEVRVNVDTEPELIKHLWDCIACEMLSYNGVMISFAGHSKDLPFLVRRSWAHGIGIPPRVVDKHKWWHKSLIDLQEVWALGQFPATQCHLDSLDRLFGGEPQEFQHFHRMFNGDTGQRQQAIQYAENNIVSTRRVAKRMGV